MTVAKITEISSSSPESFDDAIRKGIARAGSTLDNVRGFWVADQKGIVEGGKIREYQVHMRITFELKK